MGFSRHLALPTYNTLKGVDIYTRNKGKTKSFLRYHFRTTNQLFIYPTTMKCPMMLLAAGLLCLLAMNSCDASPLSDPQVVFGYNALPYTYGNGYYTPTLSYHSYRYPYVAGYGPRAYAYPFY